MKVILNCILDIDDNSYSDIKKLEHHIEWLFDLNSYPEIKSIENVRILKDAQDDAEYMKSINPGLRRLKNNCACNKCKARKQAKKEQHIEN